jgi:hypothetical protein
MFTVDAWSLLNVLLEQWVFILFVVGAFAVLGKDARLRSSTAT